MAIVRWENPPKQHGNVKPKPPSKFQAIADELRDHPREWALIAENKPSGTCGGLAHRIKHGVGPFAPEGAFEAKAVGPAGGSYSKVYARYVGEVES